MSTPVRALTLLSGGLDSAVATAMAMRHFDEVGALTFDYGQKNAGEIEAAKELATFFGLRTMHVERIVGLEVDPKQEIPGRNLVFLAHAVKHALTHRYDAIVIGSQEDDEYRDNSKEFVERANRLLEVLGLELFAPLKNLGKKGAVEQAIALGVPLTMVFSCRGDGLCGVCKTCKDFGGALREVFDGRSWQYIVRAMRGYHA